MIPYFQFSTISLGPITIQVWGLMAAIGVLVGIWVAKRRAVALGADIKHVEQSAFWIILIAFVGARLMHVIAYEPAYYFSNPLDIFKPWLGGFSLSGGLLGALVAYLVYIKKYHLKFLEYADILVYGLPAGLTCGRIGCFLIHDHPGTLTNSPLGVKTESGEVRHDLGLYLAISNLVLAGLFFFISRKWSVHKGFYVQVFLVWYGVMRFFTDFYRIIDIRYLWLTPAQYLSLLFVLTGIIWMVRSYRLK